MIPEIGQITLVIALSIALIQAFVPLAGAHLGVQRWIALAVPAALAQLLFVGSSYACLTWAFLSHDFSVLYVAKNSNSALPLIYRISGVWGSHEGSLLLWSLVLALWTGAVALFTPNVPRAMRARVLGVLGLVSCGFLLFIIITSNPFERILPAAAEGSDLNPLLQDIGLAIHPPMLYIGYVGFSVAFAFSIAALISGQVDSAWARWSRPWTNVAWLFLTLGIALGSWWAYYELGWGGWWFWDPVENASFMPWLVGTALMHSLAIRCGILVSSAAGTSPHFHLAFISAATWQARIPSSRSAALHKMILTTSLRRQTPFTWMRAILLLHKLKPSPLSISNVWRY